MTQTFPAPLGHARHTGPAFLPSQRFRKLWRGQTDADRTPWHLLCGRKLSAEFRRRSRLKSSDVGFYGFEHRPVIEL